MASGTITLPSGDKLITQTEILGSGALVHREEVIVSGTISGRLALPTNTEPPLDAFGLPVREISGPKIGVAGTPLRIDPTGTTTQPVSIASTVTVTHPGTIGVVVTSQPSISFNGPQPISSVAGTVQVAFTPSAIQNVNLLNVGFAGTPLVANISNTPSVTFSGQQPIHGTVVVNSLPPITFASPQAVTVSGTISLPDYARYSEQQSQTTSLGLIDDVIHVINAALGKVAAIGAQRNDSSPTTATEGAVAPPRITSQRAIHVNFRNEAGQEIGTAGTPLRFDPTGTTTQPVSISGTLSIPDYARYSEQLTQSTRLSSIDTDVQATTAAILGTPAVKFASPQAITFSGQQPIHGTVVVSSLPPITFASPQPISTVAGTVNVAFTPASVQSVNIKNAGGFEIGTSGTPIYTAFSSPQAISTIAGTVQVAFTPASVQSVSIITAAAGGTVLALYSEQQTQTTALNTIDASVIAVRNAVIGTPAIKFASAQPITDNGGSITIDGLVDIGAVAGTVQVAFTPASIQSVALLNVGFAGTPLRIDPTGTTTQPISFVGQQPIHGTVQVSSIPSITFASPQAITFSGQQPIHGTVVVSSIPSVTVSSLPSITFASPQPISTVAGTVSVSFPSTQSVSVSGTVSLPDYARYSEQQTQTTSLQLVDDVVHVINAALGKIALVGGQRDDTSTTLATEDAIVPFRVTSQRAIHSSWRNESGVEIGTSGTPLFTSISNTPSVTFLGQQPIHGTVQVSSLPNVTVSSLPNITFSGQQPVHGTVVVSSIPAITFASPQAITFSGQQPIHGTVQINGPLGGGVEATAVRVTLASDSTGLISVDDNGGSLTVDGSVNIGNLPTVGTVVFQSAQPVTFSGAQPISTVAGTVAVNVRNSIFTHKTARVDMGGAGNHTVVVGVANRRIKVYAMSANAERGGTINIAWLDGNLPISGTQTFVDREGFAMAVSPPAFLLAPQPGTALVAHIGTILNSGGGFRGWVSFWDDDAF